MGKLQRSTRLKLRPVMRPDADPDQLQRLFDRVVRATRAQGYRRAESETEACCYQAEDGTRCLVGHLIPASEYRPEMEGQTVRMLAESGQLFTDLSDYALEFLEELQGVHDELDGSPDDWEREFALLAEEWGLEHNPK